LYNRFERLNLENIGWKLCSIDRKLRKKEKGFTLGVIPNQLTKQTIPETTPESFYKRKNREIVLTDVSIYYIF